MTSCILVALVSSFVSGACEAQAQEAVGVEEIVDIVAVEVVVHSEVMGKSRFILGQKEDTDV